MGRPISEETPMLEFCQRMEVCSDSCMEKELEDARLEFARQALWGEEYSSDGAGSDGYDGSLEEFSARSDGSFEATGPAEAEGDGDVWCVATITAAAPADMAGTANFPGDADDVGASEGVDRDSGADVAPECGQSWTDVE